MQYKQENYRVSKGLDQKLQANHFYACFSKKPTGISLCSEEFNYLIFDMEKNCSATELCIYQRQLTHRTKAQQPNK